VPCRRRARRGSREEHFAACPGCDTYLAQMRQTIRASGQLTEDSLELRTRHDVLALFRNWTGGG